LLLLFVKLQNKEYTSTMCEMWRLLRRQRNRSTQCASNEWKQQKTSSHATLSISNHVMKSEEESKPTRPDSWQILVAVVQIESQK